MLPGSVATCQSLADRRLDTATASHSLQLRPSPTPPLALLLPVVPLLASLPSPPLLALCTPAAAETKAARAHDNTNASCSMSEEKTRKSLEAAKAASKATGAAEAAASASAAAASASLNLNQHGWLSAVSKGNKRSVAALLAASETDQRTRAHTAAAAAAALAAPSGWLSLSPAQRCFADGLALAFSHLTLAGIVAAARSCKSWYGGAKHVNSSNLSPAVSLLTAAKSDSDHPLLASKLPNLIASPLRHLVRRLRDQWTMTVDDECATHPRAWTMANLRLLHQLPHLTSIQRLLINMANVGALLLPFSFPAQLVSVDLHFACCQSDDHSEGEEEEDSDSLASSRCVLKALASCRASLTSVKLTAPCVPWDLTPLLKLKQLSELTLAGWDVHFESEHMVVLKQLRSLRRLTLKHHFADVIGPDEFIYPLVDLCQPPHRLLKLQSVDMAGLHATVIEITALQQLPALTELRPASIAVAALPSLAHFTHLRKLHLKFDAETEALDEANEDQFDDDGFPSASLFLPHLVCGASLLQLRLQECVFSEAESEKLCQMLPRLCKLTMHDVGWPSLHSLRHLIQLTCLDFSPALHTLFEFSLKHLQPLQSLRRLILKRILSPVDEATMAALKPPSSLIPSLVFFKYAPLKPLE